jgi:hypothetical protein
MKKHKVDVMTITKMDANGKVLLHLDIRFKLELGDGTIIIKKLASRFGL